MISSPGRLSRDSDWPGCWSNRADRRPRALVGKNVKARQRWSRRQSPSDLLLNIHVAKEVESHGECSMSQTTGAEVQCRNARGVGMEVEG